MSDPALVARKIRTALTPCTLGEWPTPLEEAPGLAGLHGLAGLWVKREDRSSPVYGGNKVRGLEFLFRDARAGTVFVTVGGTGSTHCLATAMHAPRISCRSVLAQFEQPSTSTSRAIADLCRRVAERCVVTRSPLGMPLAIARAWATARRLGPVRWIPGGGAGCGAVVGHFLGGLELARGDELPTPPDAIVTPLGTGGTAAGLLLAVAELGWPTQVVGVRVAPFVVANRWRVGRLAGAARRMLLQRGLITPGRGEAALLTWSGLGRGYGFPTPEGERARSDAARWGLALDPTYGAKAFAALRLLAARGFQRVVFWHTFASP